MTNVTYKIGITQWCIPGNNGYSLRLAKQLGINAVQLEFGSWEKGMALSHSRLQKMYVEESKALGIHLLPLTINALCKYEIVHGFSTANGQLAKDTILAALDAAAAMELEGITIPSFGANLIQNEHDYAHTVEALQFACAQAASAGLFVYTENVLDTAGVSTLFENCGSSQLKLLFDSQNYSVFGHNYAVDVLCNHWNKIGSHLHVKDGGSMGTMLLGTGSSPFTSIMDILRAKKYSGIIVLENNYAAPPLCFQTKDPFELITHDIQAVNATMKTTP